MFLEAKFLNLKEFRTPKFLSSITKKKRNGHIFIRDADPLVLAICGEKRHVRKYTLSCPLFYVLDNRKLSKNFDVIVQSLSHIQVFASPWTAARQVSLSFTIFWNLFKLMSVELVISFNHLILCHPSLSSYPQSFQASESFPMNWLFASGSQSYWSFSISLFSEYSGLISHRMDWFDLLDVQGILKSLLQHHNLKTSVLQTRPSLWSDSLTSIHDY